MTKLKKIKQEISSLTPKDVHKLADWIEEHKAELLGHRDRRVGLTSELPDQWHAALEVREEFCSLTMNQNNKFGVR
jgi:hypothetical protein